MYYNKIICSGFLCMIVEGRAGGSLARFTNGKVKDHKSWIKKFCSPAL